MFKISSFARIRLHKIKVILKPDGLIVRFFVLSNMLLVSPVLAAPYIIEAGNKELRDNLQWLVDRGVIDISTSTWPIPLSVLDDAVVNYKKVGLSRGDVHALISVRKYIEEQKKAVVGAGLQLNSAKFPQVGFAEQSKSTVTSTFYSQSGGKNWAAKLRVNGLVSPMTGTQSTFNIQGSYVATTGFGQLLYAGQVAHWWGPGQDGSLIWGNSATAIPGIGLQRALQSRPENSWLSWVGPWGYDLFIGQLQHDSAIPHARVLNMRLFARPLRGLEIGASRFIQWGGQGRRNSLSAIWDALVGNSNDLGRTADPGNELAGFDVRYTFPFNGNPITLYLQMVGEDEAGALPSKYLAQVGAQYKHMAGSSRIQWHVEAADTMAQRMFGLRSGLPGLAYSHTVYRSGLYHDGLPIAHPIGGSGKLYSAGVTFIPSDYKNYSQYSFRILKAEVNPNNEQINQAFPRRNSWYGGEVIVSWKLDSIIFRAGITAIRSNGPIRDNSFGVMLGFSVPLSRN